MARLARSTSAVKPRMPLRGDGRQVAQQERADAAVLPVVAHDEGDLRHVRLLVEVVAADGDDVLAVRLGHRADDRHVGAVVDEDEVLDLLRGTCLMRDMKR
jgi:hypothetical protein